MKYIFIIYLLGGIVAASCAQHANPNHQAEEKINFDQIYPLALRGEMVGMFEVLDQFPEEKLSTKQAEIKKTYYERFVDKTESFEYNTDQAEIKELFDIFISYWNSVIFNKTELKDADKALHKTIAGFIKKYHDPSISSAYLKKNYQEVFTDYFTKRDLFGLAMGKTGHLYDLYLWKSQETKTYDIELPFGRVDVPVVFMKDFISNGWSHYTTLGEMYSGGWAKKDKLFCVEAAYDLESESFKINYLTHEGQHFADYKSYPKLKQLDLEYRAKLAQLAFAEKSWIGSIAHFINSKSQDSSQAHAFANYCVIRDLSKEIFGEDYVSDMSRWHSISRETINKVGVELLAKHSEALNNEGSRKVKVYLE